MIVLVDMDGPLANFEEGHRAFVKSSGLPPETTGENRQTWDILDTVEERWRLVIREGWHSPGFFANLEPVEGAVYALHLLLSRGHEIFICTAPMINHATCAQEKLAWVRKHVGPAFDSRVIITRDKTLVHGDILIDDRPDIHGVKTPTWTHWLYDAAYTRGLAHPRRVSWSDVLEAL